MFSICVCLRHYLKSCKLSFVDLGVACETCLLDCGDSLAHDLPVNSFQHSGAMILFVSYNIQF